jgi:hypothetical protein
MVSRLRIFACRARNCIHIYRHDITSNTDEIAFESKLIDNLSEVLFCQRVDSAEATFECQTYRGDE